MFREVALFAVVMAVATTGGPAATEAVAAPGSRAVLVGDRDTGSKSKRALLVACPMPTLICSAEALVGAGRKVGGAVIGVAGDAAAGVTDSVMSGVVSWAADGAAWLVREVTRQIDRSSRPALSSPWFVRRYAGMAELAVALVGIFLLLAVGQAIVAQDLSRLLRAVFVALPSALLLTFAAVTLVELGLAVTDAMTAAAVRGTDGDVARAFNGLADLLTTPASPTLAPFVLFLSALVTAVLALVVWLELVMREAAIYVAVAFLPLTLAGLVWERSSQWSRRLAEWLFAIVLAKFTIGASFAIAASAIADGPKGGGGLSTLLAGCAVLAIAALSPMTLLRLLPFAEAAAGRSLSRGHVSGAAATAPGATTATIAARQLVLKNLGGARGAGVRRAVPGASALTSAPAPGRPGATPETPQDLPRARPPGRAPSDREGKK